ncbi:unnamed protein product [Lactuca virosa]|uniref:Uncharacterized protein n=1 Tax=Lactuca virosa TaxID=75947 RepID=A0AAU9PC87_9ASTR|nr:unnamed protein product [Lactuca virosa]
MDAISTPVISVPKIHHRLYHLKPPLVLPQPHGYISTATTTAATATSISNKTTPSYSCRHNQKLTPTQLPSTSQPQPTISPTIHQNAATGYAAALIDAALCSNSLDAVHKDVKRLLKWLQSNQMLKDMMTDATMEEIVKGRVIKEVSKKAKFQRQVVTLLKMLVAKNKSGMVAQVMEEFQRIYLDLNTCSFKLVV